MIDYDALAEFKQECLKTVEFCENLDKIEIFAWRYSALAQSALNLIDSVERSKGNHLKRCDHSNGKLCNFMKMENGKDIHCDGYRTSCSGYFEDEEINDLTSW